MTALVISLVAVAVILAVLVVAGLRVERCGLSDRQAAIAHVNRERRLAEARISRLTFSALQHMTDAATPHGKRCQCARCVGRGGQR